MNKKKKIFKIHRLIFFIIFSLIGLLAGSILAFYGTYYLCEYIDEIMRTESGSGLVSLGWLFWFITVPIGALLGGGVGFVFIRAVYHKKSSGSK